MVEKDKHTNQTKPSSAELAARLAKLTESESSSAGKSVSKATGKKVQAKKQPKPNIKPKVAKDDPTPVTVERQAVNVRAPKKRVLFKHERRALVWVLILGVLAITLGYFLSPASKVHSYTVNGLEDMSKSEVLKAAGLEKNQSSWLLLVERGYLEKQAEKNNAQVKSLKIDFVSPIKAKVTVVENVKVGYVQDGTKYFGLLSDGTKLTNGTTKLPNTALPVFENFKSESELKLVLKQFGKLKPAIRHSVSEVIWSPNDQNSQRLMIFMQDGNEVLANADDLASKLKYYPAMAAQLSTNGTVDLQQGAFAIPYGSQ
jgi:cell division protein FtsQ